MRNGTTPVLAFLCLLASASTPGMGSTLYIPRDHQEQMLVNGKEFSGFYDSYTGLSIADDLKPQRGLSDKETFAEALNLMASQHCALALVARSMPITGTSMVFGATTDRFAEVDTSDWKTIKVNGSLDYVRAKETLAKLLYHEQLHVLEKSYGLWDNPVGRESPLAGHHYPENIPLTIKNLEAEFQAGSACSERIDEEGRLLDSKGTKLEEIKFKPCWRDLKGVCHDPPEPGKPPIKPPIITKPPSLESLNNPNKAFDNGR